MNNQVLILEDKQSEFQKIEKVLNELGLNYFPTTKNEDKQIPENIHPNDYQYLKENLYKLKSSSEEIRSEELDIEKEKRDDFFNKIIDKFDEQNNTNKYSIFIIDIELKSGFNDELGVDFMEYLEQKNLNHNAKTIILSSSSSPRTTSVVDDETFEDRYKYIQKTDNWKEKLKEYIIDVLNLNQNTNNILPKNWFQLNIFDYKKKWKSLLKKGFKGVLDAVISLFFYFMIAFGIIFSVKNIITDIFPTEENHNLKETLMNEDNTFEIKNDSIKDNKIFIDNTKLKVANNHFLESDSNGNKKPTKEEQHEIDILKVSEHIFLYLIPLFIIFGFFSYYKYDFRRKLLDLPFDKDDSLSAKQSIYLTKTLFLSSILSYSIINIIEKIFLDKNFDFNILKLISFGGMLILLMTYLILSNKKH